MKITTSQLQQIIREAVQEAVDPQHVQRAVRIADLTKELMDLVGDPKFASALKQLVFDATNRMGQMG